jgi:DNA repair protein RecN (Recombination protein N)
LLLELKVKDYLIISELQICFESGLNIFTGETGSGKSIVLEAIQGLFSSRLTTDLIRVGSQQSYLESTFELNDSVRNWLAKQQIDENLDLPGTITINREISQKGSRARINGVLVTAKLASELGDLLLEIHGQSSERDILDPKGQLSLFDNFIENQIPDFKKLKQNFKIKYQSWKTIKDNLESEYKGLNDRDKELDYLRFQFNEFEVLAISDPEEEIQLKQKIDRLSSAGLIQENIEVIQQAFFESENSASSQISFCIRKLTECAKTEKQIEEYATELNSLHNQMSEMVRDLQSLNSIEEEEHDIDSLNKRVSQIQQMKRKHKVTSLEELIQIENKITERIDYLTNISISLENLEKKLKKEEIELKSIAKELSDYRSRLAKDLSQKISAELIHLGMSGAEFIVEYSQSQTINAEGIDKIEFFLKSNPGDIPRQINKVASGGELSRIMLLLKSLMGSNSTTMIFDEIDAGTSGKVSKMIGQKLKNLSQTQQVICVTHQPIVAAFADSHYLVQKNQTATETKLHLIKLGLRQERVDALIDLISGEKDKSTAKEYAEELILQAQTS